MSASQARSLKVSVERFDLAVPFVISRGAKSVADVVTVTLEERLFRGRGECVPYGRFGETLGSAVAAIEGLRGPLEAGLEREALQGLLPGGEKLKRKAAPAPSTNRAVQHDSDAEPEASGSPEK